MLAQGKSVQWHLRYFESVCRRCKEWDISRRRLEYKEMKRTDQDKIGTWLLPHHPRLLGQSQFKPCLWPGYFLLQSADCMLETCMLLAGERIHEHWWPQPYCCMGQRREIQTVISFAGSILSGCQNIKALFCLHFCWLGHRNMSSYHPSSNEYRRERVFFLLLYSLICAMASSFYFKWE